MNQRMQRLADQIQRDLAELIRDDLNDPRLTGFVTISSVKVSSDLGYADIYVTIMEPELNDEMNKYSHEQSLKVLNKAAGFLRTELSHRLKTRTTPRLRFHYDEVTAKGNYMMDLINKAVSKTQADAKLAEQSSDANEAVDTNEVADINEAIEK